MNTVIFHLHPPSPESRDRAIREIDDDDDEDEDEDDDDYDQSYTGRCWLQVHGNACGGLAVG